MIMHLLRMMCGAVNVLTLCFVCSIFNNVVSYFDYILSSNGIIMGKDVQGNGYSLI
jgi:hypothetical protein